MKTKFSVISCFALIMAAVSCASGNREKTFVYEGNPLVRDKYTADPAPMVGSDGRLYVYCGHDECFEDRPGYEGKYGFNITEWLCYSTEDMKVWTDHGVVMKPTDFSWAIGEAWVSQAIEYDGRFYFFVSTQCGDPNCKAIGVAVSDNPAGPFVDAIGRPLITDDMTDNGPRGWWNDFDPTIMIDDDGTPWLCWGNGQYYNVYASMGQTLETISYAVAPTVQGPWTFAGELMPEEVDSFTIHPGIIDYKGKSYLFYHNTSLSLDGYGPATGRRSICFTEISYDENGRIVR